MHYGDHNKCVPFQSELLLLNEMCVNTFPGHVEFWDEKNGCIRLHLMSTYLFIILLWNIGQIIARQKSQPFYLEIQSH